MFIANIPKNHLGEVAVSAMAVGSIVSQNAENQIETVEAIQVEATHCKTEKSSNKLTISERMQIVQVLLQKPTLVLEEASIYLNVSASYLYKLTSKCIIPHYAPTGKIIYFKREDLDDFMASNRRGTVAEAELMYKAAK